MKQLHALLTKCLISLIVTKFLCPKQVKKGLVCSQSGPHRSLTQRPLKAMIFTFLEKMLKDVSALHQLVVKAQTQCRFLIDVGNDVGN